MNSLLLRWGSKLTYSTRLYLSILFLLVICMAGMSFYISGNLYESLINKRHERLLSMAKHLSIELPDSFEGIIIKHGMTNASREEKIKLLNREIQPIISKFKYSHPDMGMGYYDIKLRSTIAIGPNFNKKLLVSLPENHPYLKYTKTMKPEFVEHHSSIGWNGKPVISVNYPIYWKGELIGHCWTSIKTEDIDFIVEKLKIHLLLATLAILLLGLMGAKLITGITQYKLRQFAENMRQRVYSNGHTGNLIPLPELEPLLEEIKSSREIQLKHALEAERLSTIAQLSAGLAHDIRNPLTSIKGFLQLLSSRTQSDDKKLINISLEEIDRINYLITDMLSLARPQEGKMDFQNLAVLSKGVIEFLTPEANLKGIVLKSNIQEEVPYIYGDQNQLKQVLINLLRNSLEAIDSKNGFISIKVWSEENSVSLSVTDNGQGIAPENLTKIFDPLYTTKNSGTGIGLAICRDIICKHGGKIWFDSILGMGTTVTLAIPVAEAKKMHSRLCCPYSSNRFLK